MALLPVAEALARVIAGVVPLPREDVRVEEATGRVLADDVRALRTQPPANLSAMDGYAVRGTDVVQAPARLVLVGEVAAGRPFDGEVRTGEAVRIFTGGVIPAGADTVVIQETTERDGNTVIVRSVTATGKSVRECGIDFREGDVLLPRGRRLGARDVALAAALNHPTLPVRRRPRVAIFSTGDELVPPGSVLEPGQIVSSNGIALASLARSEGAEASDFGIVRDVMEDTVAAVRRARDMGVDVLVTSGGASVGDYDLVQGALTGEGLALDFWKVAMRPGKPLIFGRLGAMRVLGVPGNPVSSYVCGLLYLVPLLRTLSGRTDAVPAPVPAVLGCPLGANDERADYLRARLTWSDDGRLVATPFPLQDSSLLVPLSGADALLIREPFAPGADAGASCRVLPLPL